MLAVPGRPKGRATMRTLFLLLIAGFACSSFAEDLKLEKKKVGRPGELTQEEEDKLDKFLQKFVQYDIRADRKTPLSADEKKIVAEFNALGPEAIPALIRTLNQSAKQSHSCPTVTIRAKLKALVRVSEDERVLDYMRDEIGTGLDPSMRRKYGLDELRFATVLRKRELYDIKLAERASQSKNPSASKSPSGSNSRTGEGPPK